MALSPGAQAARQHQRDAADRLSGRGGPAPRQPAGCTEGTRWQDRFLRSVVYSSVTRPRRAPLQTLPKATRVAAAGVLHPPPFPGDARGRQLHAAVIGRHVSHFYIVGRLGSGGMGDVYEAQDMRLPRGVAVKFLKPSLTLNQTAVKRFRREAWLAASLNHPNICTIIDVGE